MIKLVTMLTYKGLVSKFIHLLYPLKELDLDPSIYTDIDDADAMISDVSGYLQTELSKIGCVLFVYRTHQQEYMDMYRVIGNPVISKYKTYMFEPNCIHPRIPMYTYLE